MAGRTHRTSTQANTSGRDDSSEPIISGGGRNRAGRRTRLCGAKRLVVLASTILLLALARSNTRLYQWYRHAMTVELDRSLLPPPRRNPSGGGARHHLSSAERGGGGGGGGLYVKEINLVTPKSDHAYPFFTGLFGRNYTTAHSSSSSAAARYRQDAATEAGALTNVVKVLIVIVVLPHDAVNAALDAMDSVLDIIGRLNDDGSSGGVGGKVGGANKMAYKAALMVPPPLSSLADRATPGAGTQMLWCELSHQHLIESVHAVGKRHDQTVSVLKAPLPYQSAREALAQLAHFAAQKSHFVLPWGSHMRPSSNAVDESASQSVESAKQLSECFHTLSDTYLNHTAETRLAWADLMPSPTKLPQTGGVAGRVFHSHYVPNIATTFSYFPDAPAKRILDAIQRTHPEKGLILDSVRVTKWQGLLRTSLPSNKDNRRCVYQADDKDDHQQLSTKKDHPQLNATKRGMFSRNVMKDLILPHDHPRGDKQKVVFCLVTVPRPHSEHQPYVLETLRALLNSIDDYQRKHEGANKMSVVVQISGRNKQDIVSHRALLEKEFQSVLGTGGGSGGEGGGSGVLTLVDAPLHLYPTLEGLRHNFGDDDTRVYWRSKQNLDYAALFQTVSTINTEYFMMLEDDIGFDPNFIEKSLVRMENVGRPWTYINYSVGIGFAGKLFRGEHASDLALLLRLYYDEQPCDWLVFFLCELDGKRYKTGIGWTANNHVVLNTNLFKHLGKFSSLRGKVHGKDKNKT